MAARTRAISPQQQEQSRAAIQTTQLIKRLQSFALAHEGVEIDASRLKAIEILLRKSLPDLSSITLEGGDNPLEMITRIEITSPKPEQ